MICIPGRHSEMVIPLYELLVSRTEGGHMEAEIWLDGT